MTLTSTNTSASDHALRTIERIKSLEPTIGAWSHFDEAAVLKAAADIDERHVDKELYGVTVGVKDIYDTGDMPTRYGSPIYRDHQPIRDAAAVTQLRLQGALIVGKTETTEFASSLPARTRNPRNTAYSPGGSSSGSAAAVASNMVRAALGSQTLGSIIRPASYCGVVGFKPSYGRISRVGVLSLSETLDTLGVLTNSVTDAERIYRCLAEDRTPSAQFKDRQPRLAFCRTPGWDQASTFARSAMEDYVKRLRAGGVVVGECELPAEFAGIPNAGIVIHDFEAARNLIWERVYHSDKLSSNFHEVLKRAAKLDVGQYERAIRLGEECRSRFAHLCNEFDALLTLSATDEAPHGLSVTGSPAMNIAGTLLRGPCLSLPKLTGANGMPIGVQLIGPQFSDVNLLSAARWLEAL